MEVKGKGTIFVPVLSQVFPVIKSAELWLTDLEILRLHYAETLRLWRQNFLSRKAQLARVYDEGFCRMWEFYLAISEIGFRYGGLMVFQAQLARHIAAAPLPVAAQFFPRASKGHIKLS